MNTPAERRGSPAFVSGFLPSKKRLDVLARAGLAGVMAVGGSLGLVGCAGRGDARTSASGGAALAAPATRKEFASETFHGLTVTENYRWLEEPAGAGVRAWIDQQNELTRASLNAFPGRDAIEARVKEILSAPTTRWLDAHVLKNGKVLAVKLQPPAQQPVLVVLNSLNDAAAQRVLVDPNAIDGGATTMDWHVASPDGRYVAVSLSKGGTESGDVHVFDVSTGKRVDEIVPRVQGGTAGGSLAWFPDSTGFYYTRYPRAGERAGEDMNFYMQLWSRKLGTPQSSDRYEMGKELPRIAEITVQVLESKTAHNGSALATVQKGDGGEFIFFLRSPKTNVWTQITQYEDRIVQAEFGPDDAVYLISRRDAPRGKLLRMTLDAPTLTSAKTIIPEGKDTLVSGFGEDTGNLIITDALIYALYQLGGPSEVRAFDHSGKPVSKPKQLDIAAAGGLHELEGDRLLFNQVSYVSPSAWYVYDPKTNQTSRTGLATTSPVSFDDYEVVREMATSKDGTQVPVNIVRKKGMKLDSTAPALLTGYGGYGISREPAFRPVNIALLERGFVWTEANIRGGGEFGDRWHRDGALTKKQNVFDDFIAAGEHLIKRGYTAKGRLAIEGGSNGGLLVGATLVQRPDLVRAVVGHVGIYDMLRVELSPNGAFNVPEFGTVKDAEQFKALYAYSPYHNVINARYPATLLLTGMNDPRVDAMQSRKFAARLQEAAAVVTDPHPVLLRTSFDSGHGMGTPLNERIAQAVDVHTFLCWQLGVKVR